jgi:hypothetical protein
VPEQVYKARCNDASGRVHTPPCANTAEIADRDHPVARDGHVGTLSRAPRPVDQLPVRDDDVRYESYRSLVCLRRMRWTPGSCWQPGASV